MYRAYCDFHAFVDLFCGALSFIADCGLCVSLARLSLPDFCGIIAFQIVQEKFKGYK